MQTNTNNMLASVYYNKRRKKLYLYFFVFFINAGRIYKKLIKVTPSGIGKEGQMEDRTEMNIFTVYIFFFCLAF